MDAERWRLMRNGRPGDSPPEAKDGGKGRRRRASLSLSPLTKATLVREGRRRLSAQLDRMRQTLRGKSGKPAELDAEESKEGEDVAFDDDDEDDDIEDDGRGSALTNRFAVQWRRPLRGKGATMDGEDNDDDDDAEDDSGDGARSRVDWPRDPILLTRIAPDEPTFTFTRPNGTAVVYRVESLVDYLLFSGTFTEPETGLPLADEDLAELDRLAGAADLGKQSVLRAKARPAAYEPRRFSATALVGLERCCGEAVGRIPGILEGAPSREAAQVQLLTEVFPEVRHYFDQMRAADAEFAAHSLQQYVAFVQGPPNRPVRDRWKLVSFCVDFLRNL